MQPLKPYTDTPSQLLLLQQRGLLIEDQVSATRALETIGYYRLSGYWYPYRIAGPAGRLDNFSSGTTFGYVARLYEFDRKLKLLMLEALERIEVQVRVQVGQVLGQRGPLAYTMPSELDGKFTSAGASGSSNYSTWLSKLQAAQGRSREDYILHHRAKYGNQLPIWVAVGLLDFGGLSMLYSGLKWSDRQTVAQRLDVLNAQGVGNPILLQNWLRVLTYLRNICAHHSRLWNTNMTVQLRQQGLDVIAELQHLVNPQYKELNRVFGPMSVIAYLLVRVDPSTDWTQRVRGLLSRELTSCDRSTSEMGFPPAVSQFELWK